MTQRGPASSYTPAQLEEIRRLWDEGLSGAEIGRRMGMTKGQVVGVAHRNDFPSRPSPIVRSDSPKRPYSRRKPPRPATTLPPLDAVVVAAVVVEKPEPKHRVVQCAFPIGEPGAQSFRFCGETAVLGKPYCESHCRIAYQPVRDRGAA